MNTAKKICFHTCTPRYCGEIEMLIAVLEQQINGLAPDWHVEGCSKEKVERTWWRGV